MLDGQKPFAPEQGSPKTREKSAAEPNLEVNQKGGDYYLKTEGGIKGLQEALFQGDDPVLLVTSDSIGLPDPLGRELMVDFFRVLAEGLSPPKAVVFMKEAVTLLEASSACFPSLLSLEEAGVELLVCSRSLRETATTPAAGKAVDMPQLVRTLLQAKRVISL